MGNIARICYDLHRRCSVWRLNDGRFSSLRWSHDTAQYCHVLSDSNDVMSSSPEAAATAAANTLSPTATNYVVMATLDATAGLHQSRP